MEINITTAGSEGDKRLTPPAAVEINDGQQRNDPIVKHLNTLAKSEKRTDYTFKTGNRTMEK